MSNNPNQYMAASDGAGGADPQLDGAAEMLRQTKPWVRLISIMLFIGSAFMVLGGGFMMLAGVAGIGGGNLGPEFAGGIGVVVGAVYLVMSFLYIVPAVFLWQYGSRIQAFEIERSTTALVSALKPQKSFWRFCGIVMVVYLVIVVVAVCFGVFGGIVGNM